MAGIGRRLEEIRDESGYGDDWTAYDAVWVRAQAGRVILVADASNVDAVVPRYAEGVLTLLRCDSTGKMLAIDYEPTHFRVLPRLAV